ncbi:MAG: hypothetical protein NTZ09_12795, partial [Candidatus Hydrogenedentes bacterium]|nr:hypothetical protein [Candidatus Hydrogenedentota bacterium]
GGLSSPNRNSDLRWLHPLDLAKRTEFSEQTRFSNRLRAENAPPLPEASQSLFFAYVFLK